jgi:hypothetical protein
MDQFINPTCSNLPEDYEGPCTDGEGSGGFDAHSFAALRRLYIQMGVLLHDHGINSSKRS